MMNDEQRNAAPLIVACFFIIPRSWFIVYFGGVRGSSMMKRVPFPTADLT